MFDDRVEISNPGGLVKGLPPEEFGKRSLLRNPNIANLLHEIKYIEKMGSGIPKMRRLMDEARLPPVEFAFDTFFSVLFRRPVPEMVRATTDEAVVSMNFTSILMYGGVEGVSEGVKARLVSELFYVLQNGSATRKMFQALFSVSAATVERDTSFLRRLGIITFEGAPKKGRYVLTENGRSELQRTLVPIRSDELATIVATETAEVSSRRTRDEIEKIVGPELEHIPRGARGSSQNMLRMLYNMLRRHSLTISATPQTKEEVLREAVNAVREEDPDFTPEYEKDFFKC
jgi:Mn-dependent DtxR family transcriptional regulator